MIHRQNLNKIQFETHKAKQGILVSGYGPCSAFARTVQPGSEEFEDIVQAYDVAHERTLEAHTRVEDASNAISRFFARRRYNQAIQSKAEVMKRSEVYDYLMQQTGDSPNGS